MAGHAQRRSSSSSSTTPSSSTSSPSAAMTEAPAPGGGSTQTASETPMLDAIGAGHDRPASGGADSEGLATPGDSDAFSEAFNQEFARQLHVFGQDAVAAASSGPDVRRGQLGGASGAGVPASVLNELFTPTQRQKLAAFCANHVIPDRLFNGDDVGASSAQQRIVLSGHILATGEYEPGSFSQRLYARMCGHWANLVMTYAGAGDAGGRGVREEFDHEGNLSLSTGQRHAPEGMHGPQRMDESDYATGERAPERSRFRHRGLDKNALDGLAAGDWLWYYNDNGGGGGNHSVIFSRWAGPWESFVDPEMEGMTINYRRALCMSQRNPNDGGLEHTSILGDHYSFLPGESRTRVCPVTNVSRVAEDAHPVRTADDLREVLGTGRDAGQNQQFIDRLLRRHPGKRIDWDALAGDIRARNTALLSELQARHSQRLSEGQIAAIEALNAEALRDNSSAADITTLVRLNNRLTAWLHNSDWLTEQETAQSGRIEARREERADETAEERQTIERDMEALDAEIDAAEDARDAAAAHLDEVDVNPELRQAYRVRARIRGERRTARGERRATRDADARAAIDTRLEEIQSRLDPAETECDRLEGLRRANRAEVADARREGGRLRRTLAQLDRRRGRLQGRLNDLANRAGRYTAHMGRGGEFQGRGETREARSGLLSALAPQPNWNGLLVDGESSD